MIRLDPIWGRVGFYSWVFIHEEVGLYFVPYCIVPYFFFYCFWSRGITATMMLTTGHS